MGAVTVSDLMDVAASCTGGEAVVVDVSHARDEPPPAGLTDALATVPAVFVGITGSDSPSTAGGLAAALDVAVPNPEAASEVVDAVRANPIAAAALAVLLRGTESRTVGEGLVAESATYSALQAGPEFASWLASRRRRARPPDERPAVRVERFGDRLVVTLDRPHVRNAFDARMRDELLDGLAVAAADESITDVVLAGEGPSFCSGGDLDEFGTFADPASAHLLRLARSAGRAIATLADRVTAHVHGACIGAGVELPAFAGRVVAAPDATFRLPEIGMGLVPGAGGTVSLPRRIGRQQTAWLALVGRVIDAHTAHAWGLVDEVLPRPFRDGRPRV